MGPAGATEGQPGRTHLKQATPPPRRAGAPPPPAAGTAAPGPALIATPDPGTSQRLRGTRESGRSLGTAACPGWSCAGPVDTPAMKRELERVKMSQAEFEAKMFKEQCLRRILQSEDIAKCILFLVSDDAAVVTGTNLIVDGGYLART